MNKSTSVFLTVGAVAIVGFLLLKSPKPVVETQDAPLSVNQDSAPSATSLAATPAPTPNQNASTTAQPLAAPIADSPKPALRSVIEMRPALASIREDVAKDPHTPPQALMKFSIELGNKLDAVKTEDEANGFMDELQSCIEQKDSNGSAPPVSVQTICLLDAKHLNDRFPNLNARLESLRAKADPRAQTAQKQIHKLIELSRPKPAANKPSDIRSSCTEQMIWLGSAL